MSTVLLVEDCSLHRKLYNDYLKDGGHLVVATVADGASAYTAYQHFLPDFVLMDVVLPAESGFNVANKLIRMNPSVKIILYSATHGDAFASRALLNGAMDFLAKPFTKEILLSSISHIESNSLLNRGMKRLKVKPIETDG